ncbi:hypothetical protein J8281_08670 [Aquimarina sp. U1-2]|uniref:hypothetical protein n=1 Tax=Aquimarina sp. U1-2 TaxID=2823141 RepID=UPI001AED06BB|nr:hypothetical protein [Aquimarina sp. U1-2]MBP2832257.1 hypothetical protein [Aquimarina sp. U1-2]
MAQSKVDLKLDLTRYYPQSTYFRIIDNYDNAAIDYTYSPFGRTAGKLGFTENNRVEVIFSMLKKSSSQ